MIEAVYFSDGIRLYDAIYFSFDVIFELECHPPTTEMELNVFLPQTLSTYLETNEVFTYDEDIQYVFEMEMKQDTLKSLS